MSSYYTLILESNRNSYFNGIIQNYTQIEMKVCLTKIDRISHVKLT